MMRRSSKKSDYEDAGVRPGHPHGPEPGGFLNAWQRLELATPGTGILYLTCPVFPINAS